MDRLSEVRWRLEGRFRTLAGWPELRWEVTELRGIGERPLVLRVRDPRPRHRWAELPNEPDYWPSPRGSLYLYRHYVDHMTPAQAALLIWDRFRQVLRWRRSAEALVNFPELHDLLQFPEIA